MAKVRLKGNKALIKRLDAISKEGRELVQGRIEQSLNTIRNEAVSRVPVDTGFLKNSIGVEFDKTNIKGAVEVNAHYAPYIEFGTGTKVLVPSELTEYAMQFKGKGIREVNLPASPFLFPAWFTETKELMIKLEKGLSQIVKK